MTLTCPEGPVAWAANLLGAEWEKGRGGAACGSSHDLQRQREVNWLKDSEAAQGREVERADPGALCGRDVPSTMETVLGIPLLMHTFPWEPDAKQRCQSVRLCTIPPAAPPGKRVWAWLPMSLLGLPQGGGSCCLSAWSQRSISVLGRRCRCPAPPENPFSPLGSWRSSADDA